MFTEDKEHTYPPAAWKDYTPPPTYTDLKAMLASRDKRIQTLVDENEILRRENAALNALLAALKEKT